MVKKILGLVVAVVLLWWIGSSIGFFNTEKKEELVAPEASSIDQEAQKMSLHAMIKTNKGDIEIGLYDKASKTTENFITLAESGFYDGVKFHRVIDGFMIQGGDPKTKDDSLMNEWGTGGPGYQFEDEFIEGLSNTKGTISMANSGPDTNGSQFFINTADNVFLDFDKQPLQSKHAVFGEVLAGMEVVEFIQEVEIVPHFNRPVESVEIISVEIIKG